MAIDMSKDSTDMSAEFGGETGMQEARETILLRACQFAILAAGVLLILLGCGADIPTLRPLVMTLVLGAVAGLLYENRLENRRGVRDEGPIALALPAIGALSGVFLVVAQSGG